MTENFHFLAILILPNVSVSTKKVYANYRHDQTLFDTLSKRINSHILDNRIDLVVKMCANMLETCCFGLESGLAELKAGIETLGIRPCALSGSGAAMFVIIDDANEGTAHGYQNKIQDGTGCRSIIVSNNGW